MLTGIDHVIIASVDPDGAVRDLEERLGLLSAGGGRHDRAGTFNRLIWLGDSFVELMGVFDPALAASHWWGSHVLRLISKATAAYAGMAFATDDLAAEIKRLRGQGAPISDPIEGQRVRPDGDVVRWRMGRLPQPDQEMGLTFLIEHDPTAAEWRPADRAARAAIQHPLSSPAALVRVELVVANASRVTQLLQRDIGLAFRPSLAGGGARDTTIGSQTLRFVPSAADSAPTVVVRGGGAHRQVQMLGCRWLLEPEVRPLTSIT